MGNSRFVGLTPASTTGFVTATGAQAGDFISQVIDLTSGADVTSSFDPYVRYSDQVTQLDSTPSTAHIHLIFLNAGSAGVGVGTSLGSASTTRGNVTVNGIKKGDTVVHLLWPTVADSVDNASDFTDWVAPTAIADNILYQVNGFTTAHPFIVLYARCWQTTNLSIGINAGMNPGGLNVATVKAGQKILSCVDLVTGAPQASNFRPYASDDGLLLQRPSTPSNSDQILFLFE